ncbi:hypothetical protein ACROYT_G020130 [Oculina patagonica]
MKSLVECSNYRFLNESNRAKYYDKVNLIKCDKTLSGWYRFGGEAGNQMSESCVDMLRCNSYEPGWLNGPHPSVTDGAVERKVCFHVHQCCAWSTFVTVRNCGEFYVYKIKPLKRCGRFCGNGLVPVSAPTAKPVTLQTKALNKLSSRKVPTTKQTLTVTTAPTTKSETLHLNQSALKKWRREITTQHYANFSFSTNPADKRSQLKDQHSSALSPANVARELRPVLSEAEVENKEHGNQRQEIELVESAGQECSRRQFLCITCEI